MSHDHRDPWFQRLEEMSTSISAHGRFPSTRSDGPARKLLLWWLTQTQLRAAGRLGPNETAAMDRVRTLVEPESQDWNEELLAVHAYALANEGRFPSTRARDPRTAALGSWWVAQNIATNVQRHTPQQRTAVAELV